VSASPGFINTIAGGGAGPKESALHSILLNPRAVAIDSLGNIYVPDRDDHKIRKISPDGSISTVAGNGAQGFCGEGKLATDACLNFPRGVAVDKDDNIYISDSDNNRIRKIDRNGDITTIAGKGNPGYDGDGGPAIDATFNFINGLAVDSSGNIYVADTGNNCIRMIHADDGSISTFAGDGTGLSGFSGDEGPATTALLFSPYGISFGVDGNFYIADSGNDRIRKVDPDGIITTVAGSGVSGFGGDGGQALAADLDNPYNAVIDSNNNLFIADTFNYRIRKVTKDGIINSVAGTGISGFNGDTRSAVTALLNAPRGIAVDSTGTVFFADNNNHRVRSITADGLIHTLAGSGIAGFDGDELPAINSNIDTPNGVTVDGKGTIYIADTLNNRIRKVTTDGIITTLAGTGVGGFDGDGGPATAALLDSPAAVVVDSRGTTVYFSDTGNHRVRAIYQDGSIHTIAGDGVAGYSGDSGPAIAARLNSALGLAIDSDGTLYIADTGNHRIRIVTPDGVISTVAGNGIAGFAGDGASAITANLSSPHGVASEGKGSFYIADSDNYRIRKVSTNGIINTVAGIGSSAFWGDGGPATDASLGPFGIALGNSGNLYIADTNNYRIRKILANGNIITVAGDGNSAFSGDGEAALFASLNLPYGLALDSFERILIADTYNHRVRAVEPYASPSATVTINGGATQTGLTTATLALTCTDSFGNTCPNMRISTDAVLDSKPWEIFSTSTQIELPAGNGAKTVTVQFMDAYGMTATVASNITLTQLPPSGSFTINGGATLTTSRNVTLALSCIDSFGTACPSMRISTDNVLDSESWVAFSATAQVTLPTVSGIKTVKVEFRDAYGMTAIAVASIRLNLLPPVGSLTINNGALITFSPTVSLGLYCMDSTENSCQSMRITTDGVFDTEQWVPFSAATTVTLPAGNGTKSVSVEFRDINDVSSVVYTKSISFNQPIVSISSSPASVSPQSVTFVFSAPGATAYECRFDMEEGTFALCLSPVTKTLSGGSHVFEVRAVDPSGTPSLTTSYAWTVIDSLAGAAYTWGRNHTGQLGIGTSDIQPHPVIKSMPAPVGLVQASAQANHAIGLRNDNTVWVWGSNLYDLFEVAEHPSPVQVPTVPGGFENIKTVAAGGDFNMALKSDGTVWTWGVNSYGSLGNSGGTISIPGQVPSLTNITAIAAGKYVAMALKSDGTILTWGDNRAGQLGFAGSNTNIPTIVPGLSNIKQIAACDQNFMLALDNNGVVWSWGYGVYGNLGRSGNYLPPGQVSTATGLGSVSAIACGAEFAMAVSNNVVWTWGANWYGTLGIGSIPDGNGSDTPVSTNIETNGIIAAGYRHAFAVSKSNTVFAWGTNDYGQLGTGLYDSAPHPTPQEVGYLSGVTGIAAGKGFSIALTENWVKDSISSLPATYFHSTWSKIDALGKMHILSTGGDGNFRYSTNISGNWTSEILDTFANDVGIDIGADNIIHIIYLKGTTFFHKFKSITAGGQWGVETAIPGISTSTSGQANLVIDSANTIHVSYSISQKLYYVSKPSGGSWSSPYLIDNSPYGSNSLAVGSDGVIHIAYNNNYSLYYTKKTGASWGAPISLVAGTNLAMTGISPSIRLSGTSDKVVNIAYADQPDFNDHMQHSQLKFITNRSQSVSGPEIGIWVNMIIDNFETSTGLYSTLAVRNGKVGISYYDAINGDLKYAAGLDQNGPTSFRLTTLDFDGDVGRSPSYSFDAYGIAHISYIDTTNSTVKYTTNADITKPIGKNGGISIIGIGNAGYSTSQNVMLSLSCSDGSGSGCWQMKLSDDNILWPSFENYTTTKSTSLPTGNGLKTVYVKFRDAANNWSNVYSAAIFLDSAIPTGSLSIPSTNGFTNNRLVLLNTTCNDPGGSNASGCDRMKFSTDGTTYTASLPYATESFIFLPTGDGLKHVYVIYIDRAGNESLPAHASITLDAAPPSTLATPPGPEGVKQTSAIAVSLACDDHGGSLCASTYYTLDGGVETLYTVPISISGVKTTPYVLTYYSVDRLGNKEQPPKTENYVFEAGATVLTLDTPPTALQSGLLNVSGKLTRLPDTEAVPNNNMNLAGLPVTLTLTGPPGSQCALPHPCTITETVDALGLSHPIVTYSSLGHYEVRGIDKFDYAGPYTLIAHFGGTGLHHSADTAAQNIMVGASAGYAIIVEGKVSSNDGLDSHNKTTNRVYAVLKERGFIDDNIKYFNYGGMLPKKGTSASDPNSIWWAITTWAKDRMNGSPAPLYVIFVDHGNSNLFYVDPATISPTELNNWLSNMEGQLIPAAKLQKRIIILGACYSGSFLNTLKQGPLASDAAGDPNAGRIVISSAAADEQSYKGASEPDGIRSGEFFIDELFKQLKKGASLKTAFVDAAGLTRAFTSQGGASPNSVNSYNDNAVQHPLLEDDGLGQGSNTLADGIGDGVEAAGIHLGVGVTNASLGLADIKKVTPTQYLGAGTTPADTQYTMELEAYSNAAVSSAWFEVKAPGITLPLPGISANTFQLDLDLPRWSMTLVGAKWQATYGLNPPHDNEKFGTAGKYEVFYFTKSKNAEISEMRRSVVYKNYTDNPAPDAFNLTAPEETTPPATIPPTIPAPLPEAQVRTEFNMVWSTSRDLDGLTYTVQVASDDGFQTIVFQKEEIETNWYFVDKSAGLSDDTHYFWRVIAVDRFGEQTTSNQQWRFHTNNTNLPSMCLVTGTVGGVTPSVATQFTVVAQQNLSTVAQTTTIPGGGYFFNLPPGSYKLRASTTGFSAGPDVTLDLITCSPPQNPALTVIDRGKPEVTGFSIPITASSKTVSISSLTAKDNVVGALQYCLTESTSPAGCSWGPVPGQFILSGTGLQPGVATPKTVYAFARDGAGNVSDVTVTSTATLTITLPATASLQVATQGGVGTVNCTRNSSSVNCDAVFSYGNAVQLQASASWRALFGSWNGSYCNGITAPLCSFTLDSEATVTATFIPINRARVTSKDYSSLQDAYDDPETISTSVIKARADNFHELALTLDQEKEITFDGGWNDSNYSLKTGGVTTVEGIMKISRGTVKIKGPVAIR
jgi:alpha-tubulin suppressor-like RCC1 family protein/sugar lactone lactonase YvrE